MNIRSISGKGQRKNMEDCVVYKKIPDTDEVIFAVIDGMGGHKDGRKSALILKKAIENVAAHIRARLFKKQVLATLQDVQKKYSSLLSAADERVNMGCAIMIAYLSPEKVRLLWSGDCRLYVFRKNVCVFKSTPHTWAFDTYRNGLIDYEAAMWSPQNQLTGSINARSHKIRYSECSKKINPGDKIVICSDGFWDLYEEDAFFNIIQHHTIKGLNELWQKNASDNFSAFMISLDQ